MCNTGSESFNIFLKHGSEIKKVNVSPSDQVIKLKSIFDCDTFLHECIELPMHSNLGDLKISNGSFIIGFDSKVDNIFDTMPIQTSTTMPSIHLEIPQKKSRKMSKENLIRPISFSAVPMDKDAKRREAALSLHNERNKRNPDINMNVSEKHQKKLPKTPFNAESTTVTHKVKNKVLMSKNRTAIPSYSYRNKTPPHSMVKSKDTSPLIDTTSVKKASQESSQPHALKQNYTNNQIKSPTKRNGMIPVSARNKPQSIPIAPKIVENPTTKLKLCINVVSMYEIPDNTENKIEHTKRDINTQCETGSNLQIGDVHYEGTRTESMNITNQHFDFYEPTDQDLFKKEFNEENYNFLQSELWVRDSELQEAQEKINELQRVIAIQEWKLMKIAKNIKKAKS